MLLYLDQNYLSGIAKRKPAFRELDPVLRKAVGTGVVQVPESAVHRIESSARPDLGLLDLLRELSGGLRLPDDAGTAERRCARSLRALLERDYPDRAPLASDDLDLVALSHALPHCELVTCDAFMAELISRARLDTWCACELFTGRRPTSSGCAGGSRGYCGTVRGRESQPPSLLSVVAPIRRPRARPASLSKR